MGVFGEKGLIHLAPASERVPILMKGLFEWLRNSKDHLLIRSCVFHYEFEFIHPFIDGNGRIGRLWQSLILGKLHPLFEYLPIENMVYANQQKYYDALTRSSAIGQSGPFIDFMLGEILHTLEVHKDIGKDIVEDAAEIEAQFSSLFGEKFGIKFHIKFGINDKKLLVLINNVSSMKYNSLKIW
ncbi:MAG: Fic family protein [Candidatus Onthomorpha sp.]|nr:Fic family protein [Candidatus Onthomorpha sp.]